MLRTLASRWGLTTVGVVTAWWVARILTPGRPAAVFSNSADLRVWYLPVYDTFWGRVAAGELPLWNPYHLGGLPWLALLSGGFFYPPHALYLVLPTQYALALLGLAHLVLVALSTGLFVRKVGGSAAAAVLAAALFTLQGPAPQWLFQPLLLEAVAWLPLGCVAVVGIARGEGQRTVALLAATTGASLLTGGVQCTAFLLYAWTALLAAALLAGRTTLARTAAVPARFVAALVLGALMAAVQILPTMELTQQATRATGSLTVAKMFPFGYAGFDLVRRSVTGGDPLFGVVGLVLTPVALVAGRPRWLVLWALAVGTLAFGVAMGPVTPLFDAYLAIPVLSWFRTPQRILILANFCLAVLAALGLDVVTGGAARPRRWILPVGALACTIVLLHALTGPGVTLTALLAAATAGALARACRAPSLAAALVGVGVLQAFTPRPHWGQLPYGAGDLEIYDSQGAAYAKLAAAQGSDRVWVVRAIDHPAFAAKLYSRFRVRGLDDYESMNLRRQAEYFDYAMYGSTDPPTRAPFLGRVFPVPTRDGGRVLAAHRRLLDLMAVRLVAIQRGVLQSPEGRAFVSGAGLVPLPPLDAKLALFENPHALPRAFTVYRVRPAPPTTELLGRLSDPGFDPLVESYVEGDPGTMPATGVPERGEAATFVRDEEIVVELDVHLAAPGFVVLADTFYPGWRATVDGKPAAILAVNHLFRGVQAGPGRHRVRFDYRPWRAMVGAAVSLAASAVVALMWLSGTRGRSTWSSDRPPLARDRRSGP